MECIAGLLSELCLLSHGVDEWGQGAGSADALEFTGGRRVGGWVTRSTKALQESDARGTLRSFQKQWRTSWGAVLIIVDRW